jgi:small subunit ribosomal protein S8
MAEILKDANFIRDFNVIEDGKQNIVRVHLKYVEGSASITGLKKISTPGLRTYVGKEDIPKVLNGLGIAIISTSKGLLTDKQARLESIGGEVICHVW